MILAVKPNKSDKTHSSAKLIWLGAIALGIAYLAPSLGRSGVMFESLTAIPKPIIVAWKGVFTLSLAASVYLLGKNFAARLIASSLLISAIADMLLVTVGMVASGLGFALAHSLALVAYRKTQLRRISRVRAILAIAFPILVTVGTCALLSFSNQPWALGLFVLLSSSMAATALLSRFPPWLSGAGAVIFTLSDVLFFADLALFDGMARLGWLTWICFATGYALVARGAIQFIAAQQMADHL